MPTTTTTGSRSIRPGAFVGPLGVWVLMAIVAVTNGIFREAILVPRFGAYPGHVLSTAMLAAAILAIAYLYFANTTVDYSTAELVAVGVVWVVMTVGFEFLVGYLEGTPTAVTLGQYDVFGGQVWIVVPFALLVAPSLFGR